MKRKNSTLDAWLKSLKSRLAYSPNANDDNEDPAITEQPENGNETLESENNQEG